MTFDGWRSSTPCEQQGSAGDCWNCDCTWKAWKQQDANYVRLVEVLRGLRDANHKLKAANASHESAVRLRDLLDGLDALEAMKEKTNETE